MPGTPTPIQPTPQPPQPPQPTPHRQALQPAQPRQPPHPWKPPHPRASRIRGNHRICRSRAGPAARRCTIFFVVEEMEGGEADVGKFLFTERDHHARSEIRPLLNVSRRYGRMPYALPASEKVNPAAPNAGTAVLVTRFFFEACFTRGMVASSSMLQEGSPWERSYADQIRQARFMHTRKCNDARSDCIHVHERCRRIFAHCNDGPRP